MDNIDKAKRILQRFFAEKKSPWDAEDATRFASQICQLFPQPLDDKELREKVKEFVCINSGDIIPNCNECIYFNSVSEYGCCHPDIDKILALLPNIEEAKREEREGVSQFLTDYETLGCEELYAKWGLSEEFADSATLPELLWQALKKESNG